MAEFAGKAEIAELVAVAEVAEFVVLVELVWAAELVEVDETAAGVGFPEVVGIACVDAFAENFEFLKPFLDILLPPTLVTVLILMLRNGCPVPPEARFSGGGLALKKKHCWQMNLP